MLYDSTKSKKVVDGQDDGQVMMSQLMSQMGSLRKQIFTLRKENRRLKIKERKSGGNKGRSRSLDMGALSQNRVESNSGMFKNVENSHGDTDEDEDEDDDMKSRGSFGAFTGSVVSTFGTSSGRRKKTAEKKGNRYSKYSLSQGVASKRKESRLQKYSLTQPAVSKRVKPRSRNYSLTQPVLDDHGDDRIGRGRKRQRRRRYEYDYDANRSQEIHYPDFDTITTTTTNSRERSRSRSR